LSDGGWDCPAAVELTGWTKLLVKISEKLPQHAFKLDDVSLDDILFATHKLRHTAVRRLPTTCRGVETLVKSAICFAEAIQDPLRAAKLERLRSEIDSQITTLELSKTSLEDALCQELRKIKRQREELDLREIELAAKMISEGRNNNCLAGGLLQDSLGEIFDVKPAEENAGDVDQSHP
jgi:DNA polymerase kappa